MGGFLSSLLLFLLLLLVQVLVLVLVLVIDFCKRRRQDVRLVVGAFRRRVLAEEKGGQEKENCLKKRGRTGMQPAIIPRAISANLFSGKNAFH
jgi:hypothetical protein